MYADRLIKLIENRANAISKKWYADVRESSYTPNFKSISEEEAVSMANSVYQKLGYWLHSSSDEEVKRTYERFGAALFNKGFRQEEVVMTLILIKRHLWLHLLQEGIMSTDLDVYQALELNNKVVLYFDRAIYFALTGYREYRDRVRDRAS